ncbi:peptide deformylase [Sorangium sp. So ce296]|uniref:Peptide deformylase n=2 Tax=Sorangium cellulosum TaxID=56 RepID=A0A150PU71_SORCE|nr:peptide deformylase [Sorangium cellulosum]AGP32470.1 peptide deformylase [Sorangium cellulosum So0157-2]KYF59317.1 peptide deformylase [Sorangium cellulosum]KYF94372.1 peptide deformylase [Sorangium cellulosum]KYF95092.1 peptide deformylase [Sorangium cellulosum]KYG04232.1 peptide deformylase [Sorangium cellulosum]
MAIRTILHYPDPRLRQKAQPVGDITPEITKLIDDMAETMYAAPGVGLAATQIGEPHRIFLVDVASDNEPSNLLVFINPEIVRQEGQQVGPEGCLSFPGISEDIKRADRVSVRARGRDGATFEIAADGLLAVAIQHELDHLDGVLMIDRMGTLKKRIVQRKMQKRGAEATG